MVNPLIHFAGSFSPDQIQTEWYDLPRSLPPQVEEIIDAQWQRAIARPGIHLFDGPMLRLNGWSIDRGSLHLTFSPTSYKQFWGTNLHHPELADQFGPDVLANPLGLSAALQSADGFLLLGRRNARVAYYPNRIHPFAGSAETTDIFSEIRRELSEELSLSARDIAELRCLGLAEDTSIRQPEIIFSAVSNLTREQIESRLNAAEHTALWSVRCNPLELPAVLKENDLTPIAVATLKLCSRHLRDAGQ